jgi:hypothetical protein
MDSKVFHLQSAKQIRMAQDKVALEVMLCGIGSILSRLEHYPLQQSASEYELQLRQTYNSIASTLEAMRLSQES